MRTKRISIIAAVIAMGIAGLFLSGCMAGVTKEQRLKEFKADALAGNNLRGHFSGSNAGEVNSSTFSEIFDTDPAELLSFDSGNSIVGLNFSFDWHTESSGDCTATGEFTVVTDGVSETWYILWIDPDGAGINFESIPTYP